MELYFKDKIYSTTAANILRKAGYFQNYDRREQKTSYIRRLSGQSHYPRFHVYIKNEEPGNIHVHLHLDPRKTSYEGTRRHGAEYDSNRVRDEGVMIQNIFKQHESSSHEGPEEAHPQAQSKKPGFWRRVFGNMFK